MTRASIETWVHFKRWMAGAFPAKPRFALSPGHVPRLLDQPLFLVIADRAGVQRNRAAGGGGVQLDLLAGGMRVGEFRQRLEDQLGHLVGEVVANSRTRDEIVDHRRGRDVLVL